MEEQLQLKSYVRGYHKYGHLWSPFMNEVLPAEREPENGYDRFAVAVMEKKRVVGHVPREISEIFSNFLENDGTAVSCKIIGRPLQRSRRLGEEVPCIYEVHGHSTLLKKLKEQLTKIQNESYTVSQPKFGPFQFVEQAPNSSDAEDATFLQSIHELEGKMKYIVVTLHGPPGAGKTSVKQLLLGRGPLPKELQNSTDIMHTVRSVRTSRITTKGYSNFKEVTNNEVSEMLAKKVKNQIGNATNSSISVVTSSATSEDMDGQNSSSNSSHPPIDPDTEVLHEIRKLLPKVIPSNELFDLEWVYLIDSGGQPQFSDVLPLLFHHQSLHIVVFRLTDGLNVRLPIRYYQSGQNQYDLPEHLCLTNLEYIEQMCETVEAVKEASGCNSSVLVIGTYLDQLPEDERDQRLMEMNKHLWTNIYSKYESLIVPKDRDKHQIVFPVNAMVSETAKREEYSSEIQSLIHEATQKENTSLMVPVKRLVLQLDLIEQGKVLNFGKCCIRGEHLGMLKTEVQSALKFFKEIGLNLYYPDSDSDLVFTELDPLINRLSALIKASFKPPRFASGYVELQKKGLFDRQLLRSAIASEMISEDDITDNDFLSLLIHLKVIAPLSNSSKYFLPSALALSSSDELPQISPDKEPLVATFEESMFPPGFFMMLIIQLLEDESGVLSYNPGKQVTQYRNAVVLVVNEGETIAGGVLSVVDKKRWIEFNYSGPASSCSSLLSVIERALDNTKGKLALVNRKLSFRSLCIECNSNDHTCVFLKHSLSVSCSRNRLKEKKLTIQHRKRLSWLINTDQAASSSMDITTPASTNTTDTSQEDCIDYLELFRKHSAVLTDAVTDPLRVANGLSSANIISETVPDDILTITGVRDYVKSSTLMKEVRVSLQTSQGEERKKKFLTFCQVLQNQRSPALSELVTKMLNESGFAQDTKKESLAKEVAVPIPKRKIPQSENKDIIHVPRKKSAVLKPSPAANMVSSSANGTSIPSTRKRPHT